MNPSIQEIIKIHLEQNGFDGLYNSAAECGCLLDDLMPCDQPNPNCQAGYMAQGDGIYIWSEQIF
ncbi:hypothetical protein [Wielerella bovis]|uniref:hypothetical protein n=1 Tax=Wielerella bovis TaxID=2917790 RepID=UPI0020193B3D|nr:hypothetical protein [Wielerella bovis]ULJ68139.1 hypothetical protein MIS31_06320 [Wielerella bovis]